MALYSVIDILALQRTNLGAALASSAQMLSLAAELLFGRFHIGGEPPNQEPAMFCILDQSLSLDPNGLIHQTVWKVVEPHPDVYVWEALLAHSHSGGLDRHLLGHVLLLV